MAAFLSAVWLIRMVWAVEGDRITTLSSLRCPSWSTAPGSVGAVRPRTGRRDRSQTESFLNTRSGISRMMPMMPIQKNGV